MGTSNQMLPCCGHSIYPDNHLLNVEILGCPNGIDWSVIHDENQVILIIESGNETSILLERYKQEVFRFVDQIKAYYQK